MTPTEKQKCIAEQSVYGDFKLNYFGKIITAKGYDIAYNVYGILYWDQKDKKEIAFECDCNLILRPISDLIKEITHKGYNDDKPFIPLVELAKIIKPNFKDYEFNKSEVICLLEGNSRHYELYLFNYKEIILEELDLLNKLHFDTRNLIESDEAISTEVINPYKL